MVCQKIDCKKLTATDYAIAVIISSSMDLLCFVQHTYRNSEQHRTCRTTNALKARSSSCPLVASAALDSRPVSQPLCTGYAFSRAIIIYHDFVMQLSSARSCNIALPTYGRLQAELCLRRSNFAVAAVATTATHAAHELLYGLLCTFVKPRRLNADNLTPGVPKRFLAAIVVFICLLLSVIVVALISAHAVVLDFWLIVFAHALVFVVVAFRLQNSCAKITATSASQCCSSSTSQ